MSILTDAYRTERARLRLAAGPPREPFLAVVGRLLARLTAALPRLRTAVLSLGGFGCLAYAAWMVAPAAGVATAGLALLALEYLSGDQEGRRR